MGKLLHPLITILQYIKCGAINQHIVGTAEKPRGRPFCTYDSQQLSLGIEHLDAMVHGIGNE